MPNRFVRLLFYLIDFVPSRLSDSDGRYALVCVSHTYLYLRIGIYTYLSFPGVVLGALIGGVSSLIRVGLPRSRHPETLHAPH